MNDGKREYQAYLSTLRNSMPFAIKCNSLSEAHSKSKKLYKDYGLLSRAFDDEIRFLDEEAFLAAILIL